MCGSDRPDGLGLRFESIADESVRAEFSCSAAFQGYPDRLHGGVVALLLDAAMTHCLFARGIVGLTAKLSVRYDYAVALNVPAAVHARIIDALPPLYYLESEFVQGPKTCATAKGTFWVSAEDDRVRKALPKSMEAPDAYPRPTASKTERRPR